MTVIDFNEKHYMVVAQWWADHGWPVLPLEALPKTGSIVYQGVSPICAAWLYTTDSNLSLLEWTVSDRNSSLNVRNEALDLLFKTLIEKSEGKTIVGFSSKERLTDRYKRHGFVLGDEKMDFLIRRPTCL